MTPSVTSPSTSRMLGLWRRAPPPSGRPQLVAERLPAVLAPEAGHWPARRCGAPQGTAGQRALAARIAASGPSTTLAPRSPPRPEAITGRAEDQWAVVLTTSTCCRSPESAPQVRRRSLPLRGGRRVCSSGLEDRRPPPSAPRVDVRPAAREGARQAVPVRYPRPKRWSTSTRRQLVEQCPPPRLARRPAHLPRRRAASTESAQARVGSP